MKIASSDLAFTSTHSETTQHTLKESLRMWIGNQRPGFDGRGTNPPLPKADTVTLSERAKAAAQADQPNKSDKAEIDPEKELDEDPRMQLIRLMVEALTGRKIKFVRVASGDPEAPPAPGQTKQASSPPGRAGYGVEYDHQETYRETEQTTLSAQGVIRTADGEKIEFDLSLSMSREFFQEENISLRLGDARKKDPLVINFGGTAAQLTGAKFSFDLDSDGKADQISFVGAGSGFLALDANEDGKINDGSELFGTRSGDGFAELAQYDQDRNGWIDESDAIYNQLQVWTKDAQGNDSLTSLKDKGVGAISLAQVATPFAIKDEQNKLQGEVKSTGIYVNENGSVGTVQQVDLAV